MNEILDELKAQNGRDFKQLKTALFYGALIGVVVLCGIYAGNALFGNRSLDVMIDLYNQKSDLERFVAGLQAQNAVLQKEYFELIGLDPENNR